MRPFASKFVYNAFQAEDAAGSVMVYLNLDGASPDNSRVESKRARNHQQGLSLIYVVVVHVCKASGLRAKYFKLPLCFLTNQWQPGY